MRRGAAAKYSVKEPAGVPRPRRDACVRASNAATPRTPSTAVVLPAVLGGNAAALETASKPGDCPLPFPTTPAKLPMHGFGDTPGELRIDPGPFRPDRRCC
ncbi:hypothetical protein AB0O31_05095 [Kitasatospora cineracea]|uniref:hypothetical protein n=1 Tax=Kitasatospora cineracea TaxID=88074 RepID=UPI0034184EE7